MRSAREPRWVLPALLAVLVLVALLRLRLLGVPFERDEGEYAYTGQLLLRGIVPFAEAYNMKMPGIYGAYALILAIFGQTTVGVHVGLLLASLGNVALLYAVVRRLSDPLSGLIAGAALGIMALGQSVLGAAAHATHFVILFAMGGFLVLLRAEEKGRPVLHLLSGLLFGLAFLMKQHGILFALFALLFLVLHRRPAGAGGEDRPAPLDARRLRRGALFAAGVAIPFGLVCLVMLVSGVFKTFAFWTFDYAARYASQRSPADGLKAFRSTGVHVVGWQVLIWALAAIGLLAPLWDREARRGAWPRGGFAAASFLAVCPGLYFREHYFVLLLPAVAWLAAAGAQSLGRRLPRTLPAPVRRWSPAALAAVAILYAIFGGRDYLFRMSPREISRSTYGLSPFPEAVEIARYLNQRAGKNERIAVLGSEPQIYFYARRRAATGYVYTYALMENHPFAHRMQQQMIDEIEAARPRFLVFVSVPTSWLARPGSDRTVFDWFTRVSREQYAPVCWADILSAEQTRYVWGRDAVKYQAKSPLWLAVLERR